jgi:predicted TIM-barrel fold metal-dependent hydrolase
MPEQIATPKERQTGTPRVAELIIDSDVHHNCPSPKALLPYLSEHWRQYMTDSGFKQVPGSPYPKMAGYGRMDSLPPGGGPPGSDPSFVKQQLLDEWNIEYAVLNSNYQGLAFLFNRHFAAALATAMNEWTAEHWLDFDPRFRASIHAPIQDPEQAAREIDRVMTTHKGFVQVLFPSSSPMPYGNPFYYPVYEAAVRHNIPIGIHLGGHTTGTGPSSANGWLSYYIEFTASAGPLTMMSTMISMTCEGVFNRFPTLKVILIEGGLSWVPCVLWRLDRAWKTLRYEVPWLDRKPSEFILEHFRATTQPIEEPNKPVHLEQMIEMIGDEKFLLFSTDYPHWDFDAPTHALMPIRDKALRRRIMYDNAKELYGF